MSDDSGSVPDPGDPPATDCGRDATRGGRAVLAGGVRLAVTVLTVLPLRPGRVGRSSAAVAMTVAPAVGACLGVLLAGVLVALTAAGAPVPVAAAMTVAAAAMLTRGLHLDGLADTVDALGSYRSEAGALQIMKKPDIGPFGVVAIALALLVQVGSLGGLAGRGWLTVTAVTLAHTAGRLGATVACRRPVPPARSDGLGALVAGTVPTPVAAGIAGAVALAGVWAVPGRPWQGPLAVVAALSVAVLLVRHAVRRFGGITGDVIGAAVELCTTVALVVLVLGHPG